MKRKKKNNKKVLLKKWFHNLLIFSGPLLVLFLESLRNGTPITQAAFLLYAALINALIDLLKKYYSSEK